MSKVYYLKPRGIKVISILVTLLIVSVVLVGLMVESVGVGEVAVIIDPITGNIVGSVMGPRYFVKMPWQTVDKIYVAIKTLDMWTDRTTGERGDYPAVTSLTKDGLEVDVDITLRWRIDAGKVIQLYRNYPGKDWVDKTLAPRLRKVIRDIISNYTAVETIEKRTEIANLILEKFTETLTKEKSLGNSIIVEGIDLRNIDLPERFRNAIEEKLTQQQLMIAASYNRSRILVLANATAEAAILKALGEAKAKIIAANATANALEMIISVIGENTTAAQTYLTFLMLRDIAQTGQNIYIIIGSTGSYILPIERKG